MRLGLSRLRFCDTPVVAPLQMTALTTSLQIESIPLRSRNKAQPHLGPSHHCPRCALAYLGYILNDTADNLQLWLPFQPVLIYLLFAFGNKALQLLFARRV